MVRAGVNPDIARQISAHRTPAIFSRNNIIDEADLRRATELTSDNLAGLPVKSNIRLLRPPLEAAAGVREPSSVHNRGACFWSLAAMVPRSTHE